MVAKEIIMATAIMAMLLQRGLPLSPPSCSRYPNGTLHYPCPPAPTNCRFGLTKGWSQCCEFCAVGPGEYCGLFGDMCAKGLRCQEPEQPCHNCAGCSCGTCVGEYQQGAVTTTTKPKAVNIANILEKSLVAAGVVSDIKNEQKKPPMTTEDLDENILLKASNGSEINITESSLPSKNESDILLKIDSDVLNSTSKQLEEIVAYNKSNQIVNDLINESKHVLNNDIEENTETNHSVSTIVDEMEDNISNLTITSSEVIPIDNITNETKNDNLTIELIETTTTTLPTAIVTSIPALTTDSIQSEINQTQDKQVYLNVISDNESPKSDNGNLDSMTNIQPMNMNNDTKNSTVITSELDSTESLGDKSKNSMKPLFNISELKAPNTNNINDTEAAYTFKNESHVLIKIDADVETSTILNLISPKTPTSTCIEEKEE